MCPIGVYLRSLGAMGGSSSPRGVLWKFTFKREFSETIFLWKWWIFFSFLVGVWDIFSCFLRDDLIIFSDFFSLSEKGGRESGKKILRGYKAIFMSSFLGKWAKLVKRGSKENFFGILQEPRWFSWGRSNRGPFGAFCRDTFCLHPRSLFSGFGTHPYSWPEKWGSKYALNGHILEVFLGRVNEVFCENGTALRHGKRGAFFVREKQLFWQSLFYFIFAHFCAKMLKVGHLFYYIYYSIRGSQLNQTIKPQVPTSQTPFTAPIFRPFPKKVGSGWSLGGNSGGIGPKWRIFKNEVFHF